MAFLSKILFKPNKVLEILPFVVITSLFKLKPTIEFSLY